MFLKNRLKVTCTYVQLRVISHATSVCSFLFSGWSTTCGRYSDTSIRYSRFFVVCGRQDMYRNRLMFFNPSHIVPPKL